MTATKVIENRIGTIAEQPGDKELLRSKRLKWTGPNADPMTQAR